MDYKLIKFRRYSCQSSPFNEKEDILKKKKAMKQFSDGQILPWILQKRFPNQLIGKPIEEIDPFYHQKNV